MKSKTGNEENMKPEFKPCPFCGGEASIGKITYDPKSNIAKLNKQNIFYFVNCITCGASNQGLVGHSNKNEATTHWNTRILDLK